MSLSKAKSAESLDMSLSNVEVEAVEVEFDVEETLKWLDELWLSGEIKETMTEEEYQEFRKAIENSEK